MEILADEAWAELGEIPKEDVAKIRENADFDIDRILEIEQETRQLMSNRSEPICVLRQVFQKRHA